MTKFGFSAFLRAMSIVISIFILKETLDLVPQTSDIGSVIPQIGGGLLVVILVLIIMNWIANWFQSKK